MSLAFEISDLRRRPEFFDLVADRIWRAWWEPHGHPFDTVRGRLADNMNAEPIPLALIAHEGKRFLGTASVIESDLDERPQLSPWVAAVWVEPDARRHGIGAALVDHATEAAFFWALRASISARGVSDRISIKVWGGIASRRVSGRLRSTSTGATPNREFKRSPP
jgi:GNAT superfamily N-acetyltransferase